MSTSTFGKKREVTMVRVTKRNRDKLRKLKDYFNLPTYDSIISHILCDTSTTHAKASYKAIMADNVPVILTGLPGAGKTHFLKTSLIPKIPGNVPILLIDIHGEYKDLLKEINFGDFFSLNFKKNNEKFRLAPSSNVDVSKSEIDSVFRHLTMFQKDLSNWILVLEEAHRFAESSFVRSFLAESRKHTRKVVVVAHQIEAFKGLGRILAIK